MISFFTQLLGIKENCKKKQSSFRFQETKPQVVTWIAESLSTWVVLCYRARTPPQWLPPQQQNGFPIRIANKQILFLRIYIFKCKQFILCTLFVYTFELAEYRTKDLVPHKPQGQLIMRNGQKLNPQESKYAPICDFFSFQLPQQLYA